MVNRHAALFHHLLEVPVAQRVGRIPADADQDHIDRKAHPFEVEHINSSRVRALKFTRLASRLSLMRQNPCRCCSSLRIVSGKRPESTQVRPKLTALRHQLLRVNVSPGCRRIYATTPLSVQPYRVLPYLLSMQPYCVPWCCKQK